MQKRQFTHHAGTFNLHRNHAKLMLMKSVNNCIVIRSHGDVMCKLAHLIQTLITLSRSCLYPDETMGKGLCQKHQCVSGLYNPTMHKTETWPDCGSREKISYNSMIPSLCLRSPSKLQDGNFCSSLMCDYKSRDKNCSWPQSAIFRDLELSDHMHSQHISSFAGVPSLLNSNTQQCFTIVNVQPESLYWEVFYFSILSYGAAANAFLILLWRNTMTFVCLSWPLLPTDIWQADGKLTRHPFSEQQ